MALQTTLASWVRTATSLIGFGLAIVQFLEHFGRLGSGAQPSPHFARILGLILISAGILTTAIATGQYRIAVKYWRVMAFEASRVFGPCVANRPTLRSGWRSSCVSSVSWRFALILTTIKWR